MSFTKVDMEDIFSLQFFVWLPLGQGKKLDFLEDMFAKLLF